MAGAAVAVAVRHARQDIVRHFTGADALGPESAVPYDPDADGWRHARIRRRTFRRMREFGAVKEPRPGLFYLDEGQLDAFRWHMRRRAFGILAVVGAAAAAAVAALA